MTSIASVADTAEEKFVPYYDLFMPSLKHIVENAVQKELRLLRGKTIECISLIGLAVGKEKVRPHRMRSSRRLVPLHVQASSLLSVLSLVHAGRLCRHAAAPQNPDGLQRPGRRRSSGRKQPRSILDVNVAAQSTNHRLFVFLDLIHDLRLGQDVQDPREGVSAVPASGDGPADEDGLDQAGGGTARQ